MDRGLRKAAKKNPKGILVRGPSFFSMLNSKLFYLYGAIVAKTTMQKLVSNENCWMRVAKWQWTSCPLPIGSAEDTGLVTSRRQEVLGPGVRASRWEGELLPDLEDGDWHFSDCRKAKKSYIQLSMIKGIDIQCKTHMTWICAYFAL